MPVNVTVSSDIDDDNGRVTRTRHASARERRCIVSGVVLPEARLVRFALDGEGRVTPDIAAKLPGRGMWVSADRESVSRAVAKNMFSRAAQTHAKADANLADRVETLLAAQLQGWLGLARRAGQLLLGFDVIERTIRDGKAPLVIVEASDAGAEGQRKLQEAAEARGIAPFVVTGLTRDEIGRAHV